MYGSGYVTCGKLWGERGEGHTAGVFELWSGWGDDAIVDEDGTGAGC